MGYIRHHAIVVTTWETELLKSAHEMAKKIFDYVSPISKQTTNGYCSFFIPPDGSKEGWEESDNGDQCRKEFLDWCDEQAYEDGSNCLAFVEVYYGDDYNLVGVTRSNAGSNILGKKDE